MTERSDRSEQEVANLLARLRIDPADQGFQARLSARLAEFAEGMDSNTVVSLAALSAEREVAGLLGQLRVDPEDNGFGANLSARLAAGADMESPEAVPCALSAIGLAGAARNDAAGTGPVSAGTVDAGSGLLAAARSMVGGDPELSGLLAELRLDPVDNGFAAGLSARLTAAATLTASTDLNDGEARRAVGWGERIAAWFKPQPWLVGSCAGALTGVAVFVLLQATQGASSAAGTTSKSLSMLEEAVAGVSSAPAACPPVLTEVAEVEVFELPAGKVALVHLQFDVEQDVDAAEFSVLLPPGLSFYGGGEVLPERVFRWEAPLTAGENRVPVAIVGQQPGQHRVTATATVGSEVVVHELVLDVQGAA